jgi:hypothetical protein
MSKDLGYTMDPGALKLVRDLDNGIQLQLEMEGPGLHLSLAAALREVIRHVLCKGVRIPTGGSDE